MSCVCVCLCVVEVYWQLGRGSGLRRLQGGSELLHEQEEEPTDRSDVHRPVQQIPSECSRRRRRSLQVSGAVTNAAIVSFPGFVRGHVGCNSATHYIRGQSAPTGKDYSPLSAAGTVNVAEFRAIEKKRGGT